MLIMNDEKSVELYGKKIDRLENIISGMQLYHKKDNKKLKNCFQIR